ncbi:hypothetical protein TWF481_010777 [Arthrobotrys musiformis]|uniref:Uncharacterized protein n=1 Tax=Arthrobotrys musiformis TaxID=47236 RepID=A0AAV9W1Q4_9PEZI
MAAMAWPNHSRLGYATARPGYDNSFERNRSDPVEKYKHHQRYPKVCWFDIFVEIYEYITHSFTAIFRFPTVVFLVGIGLGYFISLHNTAIAPPSAPSGFDIARNSLDFLSQPSIRVSDNAQNTDPYFLPSLPGSRYPAVPYHNVLRKDSPTFVATKKLITQSPMTPLFVPFGRNHLMLRQTVLSYIAAGWPRSQIYIIDNTGTMDANLRGLLSDSNPFHMDYNLYRSRYGVNIIRTPTLLTFAQLQNFMLSTAMGKGWTHYYWTHQDVVVLSDEGKRPYKSFYEGVVSSLVSLYPGMNSTGKAKEGKRWGLVWYDFDHLSLVNVGVAADTDVKIGAWDVFIPYYNTDCDYYERMRLHGFEILERRVGDIFDVAEHVSDPEYSFFGDEGMSVLQGPGSKERKRNEGGGGVGSRRYKMLKRELKSMTRVKNVGQPDRNIWQDELKGGQGEPWTYDSYGFETAWWTMATVGRSLFQKKWGTADCKPSKLGKGLTRIWNAADDYRYNQGQNGFGYRDYDHDHDHDVPKFDDDDDDDNYDYYDDEKLDEADSHWDSVGGMAGTSWNDPGLGMAGGDDAESRPFSKSPYDHGNEDWARLNKVDSEDKNKSKTRGKAESDRPKNNPSISQSEGASVSKESLGDLSSGDDIDRDSAFKTKPGAGGSADPNIVHQVVDGALSMEGIPEFGSMGEIDIIDLES